MQDETISAGIKKKTIMLVRRMIPRFKDPCCSDNRNVNHIILVTPDVTSLSVKGNSVRILCTGE